MICACCVAGCDLPGKPNPADRPVPPDQVTNFDTLYRQNCAGCHGADGKLGPAPPLNDPLFLAIVPDAELLQRDQRAAVAGTPMPAFAQRQRRLAHRRSRSRCWPKASSRAGNPPRLARELRRRIC